MFVIRRFLLVVVLAMVVPMLGGGLAHAAPPNCATLPARIAEYNAAYESHEINRPNPADRAGVAAYNEEARRGTAWGRTLYAEQQACNDQGIQTPPLRGAPARPQSGPAPQRQLPPAQNGPAPSTSTGGGAPKVPLSPAKPGAPVVGQQSAVPLPAASDIARVPGIPNGRPYNLATATGARLGAPSPLPSSLATNSRFTAAPSTPMQGPGLNTAAGVPAMTSTQQQFFATAPRLIGATRGIVVPSNSRGTVFRLPDLDGTGRTSNSGPALLIGPGGTRVVAGPLDPLGRSTGVFGTLDAAGLRSGRRGVPTIAVPGAQQVYQRGHLWPNQYYSPGNLPQFLAPELRGNNAGSVRVYETYLGRVAGGTAPGVEQQVVTYLKVPLYQGNNAIPDSFLVQAWGSKGWNLPPTYIRNY